MNNPIRTCIVCRNKFPQAELIRITHSKNDEFKINEKNASGRSNYICFNQNCIKQCVSKKILSKKIKKQVPEEVYQELEKYIKL